MGEGVTEDCGEAGEPIEEGIRDMGVAQDASAPIMAVDRKMREKLMGIACS